MARVLNEGGKYTSPFSNLYLHLPPTLAHQNHFSGFHVCNFSAAHSCSTLYNSMDCSLPGFSVHAIFQARVLEWVAISSSRKLPDPGIKRASPVSPALAGRFFTRATWKALDSIDTYVGKWCAFLSFWLSSLWITGSRFSHLARTDPKSSFFMAE